ncbi:MAG: NifU N-terminal domain-containing protein [Phycisphaerales bacterium]
MPTITAYQDTPNPNALKCVLSAPLAATPGAPSIRSYTTPAAAAHDPAAAALLAVKGVRAVLISDGWLTVTKQDATSWRSLKPALEQCLGTLA